jgi:hypothetical protein
MLGNLLRNEEEMTGFNVRIIRYGYIKRFRFIQANKLTAEAKL